MTQREWLRRHYPTISETFVEGLRQEALRRERENPHKALAIAAGVRVAAEFWGDAQTQAVALHIEADARRLLAEHQTALNLYQQAADIYHSLGQELKAAHVAIGRLATMQYLGLYEEALALAAWAGDVFHVANDQLSLGKMWMNRGNIFGRRRQHREARHCYTEAHAIFSRLDDQRHLAMVNVNAAIVLTELDNFLQAEHNFYQARAYFVAQGMESVVAQVDHNIAYLYFAQGQYQKSLLVFNRARAVFEAQGNLVEVANVDLLRSDIYLAMNLWQEALEQARTARPIFETANMPWETARLHLNEAAAQVRLDKHTFPDEALDRARHIFTQEQNPVWLAMTDLYQASFATRRNEWSLAEACAQRALVIFMQNGFLSRAVQCEIILGEVALRQGDYLQGSACFSAGLDLLQTADMPAVSFGCYFGLGCSEQYQGRPQSALPYLRQAVASIERLQAAIGAEDYKIAFLQDKQQVYESLVFLCLELRTVELEQEAFATVEQAKSRALLDALARESLPPVSPVEAELLEDITRLKSELNWYYNRLNHPPNKEEPLTPDQRVGLMGAVTRREQALSRLFNRWHTPDLVAVPHNPVWTVNVSKLQRVLPEDVLLLEFYTGHEGLVVFGVTREELWSQRLTVSSADIAGYLGQLRFQMNKFSYGPAYQQRHMAALQESAADSLHRLYELLLAPIQERLTAPVIVVVPHGLLHYVPFHALYDGQRYLLEHKTLSYAPSATILHRVLTAPPIQTGDRPFILGLSDPTIPYAETEVETIAALFPGANLRLGEGATLETLMADGNRPAFIHLSTHAAFRADNPLFSAVKLADGWLSVSDIYAMNLAVPLVTLSACETGRYQVVSGDELVGLCRGFFAAGARSMVVSLWTADDPSTARLMAHFYEGLLEGLPVNQALQAAQLALKAELPHPYYWAAFFVTGDFKTVFSIQ